MKLAEDWQIVVRHAWSVRFLAISIILNGLAAALVFGDALPIAPIWLFLITLLVNLAAGVARLVAQKQLPGSA